jgi:hypothetical protein
MNVLFRSRQATEKIKTDIGIFFVPNFFINCSFGK